MYLWTSIMTIRRMQQGFTQRLRRRGCAFPFARSCTGMTNPRLSAQRRCPAISMLLQTVMMLAVLLLGSAWQMSFAAGRNEPGAPDGGSAQSPEQVVIGGSLEYV